MDNKEFEKRLEQIKTFKEVPISVDEKIQKAFDKIEENEKIEREVKKQRSKFNFSRVLSLAASFVMAIFLAGNGVAYAKGEPNIYSWVLEKIGIEKEYTELKTDINKIVESNGIKITLLDCGYDSRVFMARYKIEDLNGRIKEIANRFNSKESNICNNIYGDYKFYTTNNQEVINPDETINNESQIWEKISDYEYIVCDSIIISEIEWDGTITDVKINLNGIKIYNINDLDNEFNINGKWNFEIDNLINKYSEYKYQQIDVNKQIDEKIIIDSIRVVNTGVWGILEVDYKNENYDLDYDYIFEVIDKDNNKIGKFGISSNSLPITYKYMFNLNKNEKYEILIYDNLKEDYILEKIEFVYNK